MPKVLVTGSNGLVGQALRAMNLQDYYFTTRDEADLRDPTQTEKLFMRVRPDKVLHLAAVVGGLGENLKHSGDLFRDNMLINLNVLESARNHKVEKVVSFMSTCVFPSEANLPLSVDQLHNGAPHHSSFGYAYAKRMLAVQSDAYRNQFGCNFVTLIPTNIYGPGDNWNLNQGHVIPSLIHKFFKAAQESSDVTLWGTGSPLREFVYSSDIANLAIWALFNYDEPSPLIISPSEEISIKNIAIMIADRLQFQGNIIWDTNKPDGQLRKPSDAKRLKVLLPEVKFTTLDVGLTSTVDWFTKNYPKVRL